MAELTDEEVTQLSTARALLAKLNGDPEARRHLERSLKAVYPNVKTTDEQLDEVLAPRLAKVADLETKLTERLAKMDEDEKTRAESAEVRSYEQRMADLRKAAGLTDEGMEEVRRLMVDRNIADPEAAFALFERMKPPAVDTSPSYLPQKWDFQENAVENDTALLWERPQSWADKMIPVILADERREPARV